MLPVFKVISRYQVTSSKSSFSRLPSTRIVPNYRTQRIDTNKHRNGFSTANSISRPKMLPQQKEFFLNNLKYFLGNNDMEQAERLMEEAKESGFEMELSTYKLFVEAYMLRSKSENQETLNRLQSLYYEMKDRNVKMDRTVFHMFLIGFGRQGSIMMVEQIVKEMVNEGIDYDEKTYGILVDSYGRAYLSENAINLFEEMKSKGFQPTEINYIIMLDVCSHNQRFDLLDKYWNELKEKIPRPGVNSYTTVVEGLCRAGKFIPAMDIVEEMQRNEVPFNYKLWVTLTGFMIHNGIMVDEAKQLRDRLLSKKKLKDPTQKEQLLFSRLAAQIQAQVKITQLLSNKVLLDNSPSTPYKQISPLKDFPTHPQ